MTCNRNIWAALAVSLCLPACARSDSEPAGEQAAPKVGAATARASADGVPALDQVLARHFAALGGEGKLRAATTLTYSGTATTGDKRVKVAKYYKRGHRMRVEKDDGEKVMVMAVDGAAGKAWKRDGDGVSELPAEKAAYLKKEADIDDALLTYERDGHAARLVGMAKVDGKPAYEVELVKGDGAAETRYIDARTYFEVKRVMTWKDKDGKAGEATAYFSDYRDVGGGMMVNHRAEIEREDGKTVFVIESAAYDQPLDDARFQLQPIM